MCRLNPKVDFAFKKLFGSEENKDILISFINSILSEDQQVKDIILRNPYNIANYKSDKMSILDIKAVDEKGTWYDIEMQLSEQVFYEKRAFYYWAKVYSDQLEGGYNYDKLRKTISINILDFDYIDEDDFHNVYKVYNEKSKKEFSSVFEMHFIELNKFKKDFKDVKTTLDRWIAFLNRAYELEKDKIPTELAVDESVKKAVEKLDVMYLDREERELYEGELKAIRDYIACMQTAEIKGIQQGIQRGIEQGIQKGIQQGIEKGIEKGIEQGATQKIKETVIQANKLGMDNITISKLTGLTEDEINQIITPGV
ncbi:Rpn family recombination-promoting nuclease/putative transposase [Clostridium botulinum]|uniref:Rpn family recombination-promoting nuclease/putative transposase n=1 Tax=Clostridium TaxID=1485 RepID=UPI0013F701DD|nr:MULTISPECIES: Rpn family recombination-promoting nuclease/putative transposase [Clostridium]MCS6103251.1 Rpn family recombination-promoting nuclease/putative transposase [Clostridium botulinum]MCS6106730.1 Rpn family recombination-promoting nuclease/putative transposase [Clostridium botulinum]MCS6130624.1 Rpn family recombination-promoting nuclease/putative transposase [Clostridium botulinum]NFL44486.1 Rpn family recombination-promoting nuclease/putative transposase [Clostridium botulinum]N